MSFQTLRLRLPDHSFLALSLCLALLVARAWERLVYAELWAEDALRFVSEGLNFGFASLAIPVDGSYHTIQRLIALFGIRVFPLAWLPTYICVACFFVIAIVASKISSKDYEWLIPSKGARVGVALLYCLAPGLNEMLGSLANINWSLFFWLALVLLKNPKSRISWMEVFGILIVAASAGTFILLIPLLCWRLWMLKKQNSAQPLKFFSAELVSLLILVSATLWLIVNKADRPPSPDVSFFNKILNAYLSHLIRFVGILPWLGTHIASWLSTKSASAYFAIFGISLGLLLVKWIKGNFKILRVQALLLFVAGVSLWSVLCMLTRPAALGFFLEPLSESLLLHRYSFPTFIGAIFFWMSLIHPKKLFLLSSRKSIFAFVFIVLNFAFAADRFIIPRYGSVRYWQASVDLIESARKKGCGDQVIVKCYPEPWTMSYLPPKCLP